MSSITTDLTGLMQILYDRVFLDRAELELVYDFAAQVKKMPKNSGKTIYFNRFTPLGVATTALTEATNPTAVDMSTTIVSATIAEYGNYTKVGSLFEMTSIDEGLKEHAEVMGQNGGETLDTLIAAELSGGGTTQLAGAKSNITAVAATDTLTGAEIRKAVRTLKVNKAKKFPGGFFRGIANVYGVYDLRGNTEWLDAWRYTDTANIQNGAIGRLHGVEFVETNNTVSEASTVTVYHTYICGQNGYGILNIEGQTDLNTGKPMRNIYVKHPGPNDTSNPLDMYSTIGWKANFVAKVLNANWVIIIKHGATA